MSLIDVKPRHGMVARDSKEADPLMTLRNMLLAGAGFAVLAACTHTIKIEPSDKPIKIDLNITQEVRIILDKEVEELIADNPDLF